MLTIYRTGLHALLPRITRCNAHLAFYERYAWKEIGGEKLGWLKILNY